MIEVVIFFMFRIWHELVLVSDTLRFCFILLSYGLIIDVADTKWDFPFSI